VKEIKSLEKKETEFKNFYFNFQNMEFKSQIPTNVDQSIGDFLVHFSKDRTLSAKREFKREDFEVCKGGKYLNHNILINKLETGTDKSEIIIYEDKLALNNIRFRNYIRLLNPFEASDQSLQVFLNKFIESVKIDKTKIDTNYIKTLTKTLGEFKSNKSKGVIAVLSLLEKIRNLSDNKINLDFHTNFSLDMSKLTKRSKDNLFIIKNVDSGFYIPVNFVVSSNVNESKEKFDNEIIDNFDTLRRISRAYDIKSNFGIVTDFYNWKFNFYRREENLLEKERNFLTSLKYDLSVNDEYINENGYLILLKVLSGITSVRKDFLDSQIFS